MTVGIPTVLVVIVPVADTLTLPRHGNTEMMNILSFCEEVTQYRVCEERKADRGILKRSGWRIWHNFMAPG